MPASYIGNLYNTIDQELGKEGLYCCDASRVGDSRYPLCTANSMIGGCFLSESSIDLVSIDPVTKEWCVQTGLDENCVIDGRYLSSSTLTMQATFLDQEVYYTTALAPSKEICESYSSVTVSNQYKTSTCPSNQLPDSCQSFQVSYCYPDTSGSTIGIGVLGPKTGNNHCVAICENRGGTYSDCREYCTEYICDTRTVYEGPGCNIPAACQPSTPFVVEEVVVDPTTVSSCIPATEPPFAARSCAQGGCTFDSAGTVILFDEPEATALSRNSGYVFNEDNTLKTIGPFTPPTPVEINYTINPQPGQGYCVPHGTVLNDNGNLVVCGDDDDVQYVSNFGDYWCPEEFIPFGEGNTDYGGEVLCAPAEDVCDFGRPEDITCGTIFGSDDSLFGDYNAECVVQSQNVNAYEEACCLEASFNGFEIYGDGVDTVTVY